MALWGLDLGLGLGAAYGTLVGIPFGIFGILFGPPLGAMCGAITGLPLGLLEGTVLGAVTVLRHRRDTPGDDQRYGRKAGLACAAVCIVALALFLELMARTGGTSFVGGPAFTRDLPEVLIVFVGPSLVATGASWWAARRVAVRYARETSARSPLEERQDAGT